MYTRQPRSHWWGERKISARDPAELHQEHFHRGHSHPAATSTPRRTAVEKAGYKFFFSPSLSLRECVYVRVNLEKNFFLPLLIITYCARYLKLSWIRYCGMFYIDFFFVLLVLSSQGVRIIVRVNQASPYKNWGKFEEWKQNKDSYLDGYFIQSHNQDCGWLRPSRLNFSFPLSIFFR